MLFKPSVVKDQDFYFQSVIHIHLWGGKNTKNELLEKIKTQNIQNTSPNFKKIKETSF